MQDIFGGGNDIVSKERDFKAVLIVNKHYAETDIYTQSLHL